jgi:hypothetical protein
MKFVTMRIFIVLFCFAVTPYCASDATLVAPKKFPVSYEPAKGVEVKLSHKKGRVVANFRNGESQDLGPWEKADIEGVTDELVLGDFNFDGTTDVGVLEGVGYGGVNLFYRVYLFDMARATFVQFNKTVSNPAVHAKQKFLISAQRSGPRWYQTIFMAKGGKLGAYAEAEMLDDPTLWGVRFLDADGKERSRAVLEAGDLERLPAKYGTPIRRLRSADCLKPRPLEKIGKTDVDLEVVGFDSDAGELRVRIVGEEKHEYGTTAECLVLEAQ